MTRPESLCPTRWVQRHDALNVFVNILPTVSSILQDISESWTDRESSSNAQILLSVLQTSEFLVSLFVAEKLFSISLPLTKYLQTVNVDVSSSLRLADDVLLTVRDLRSCTQEIFHELFEHVKSAFEKLGLVIEMPRLVGQQRMRSNVPSSTPQEYLCRCVLLPFLEAFTEQINEKFLKHKAFLLNLKLCFLFY